MFVLISWNLRKIIIKTMTSNQLRCEISFIYSQIYDTPKPTWCGNDSIYLKHIMINWNFRIWMQNYHIKKYAVAWRSVINFGSVLSSWKDLSVKSVIWIKINGFTLKIKEKPFIAAPEILQIFQNSIRLDISPIFCR